MILCGQQIFANRLQENLDVQLVRLARVKDQLVDSRKMQTLPSKDILPSLTCSDDDISGVRIRIADKDADWSEQFAISGEMSRKQLTIMVSFNT